MPVRLGLVLILGLLFLVQMTAGEAAPAQTPELIYKEAQTVYFGNIARRQNGVPPLRWNKQLTEAARWFAWDSTVNQPPGYCGHQDSQGNWPVDRARVFGYKGGAGAENAYCGYVEPQDAINGWMNSPGHRANLLDPNSREVGLGYYRRKSDGRGYVVQMFGADPVYPPVIVENEALTTTTTTVNLYIYDGAAGSGFAGMGPATQMLLSNDACFTGANWQAYGTSKTWTLQPGTGWRTAYVKTRDLLDRTSTVSDTIYLGANLPLNELGDAQQSTTQSEVTLYHLDSGGLPQAQFSLGWMADDGLETFKLNWGNGARVNDAAARGGTAFRLTPGNGESFAWVWTTEFVKAVPLVAYFRLKVNDNSATGEVARISVKGGGTEYGPRSLKGTDFLTANQYQEFAVPFTFKKNANDPFLILNFWRSGAAQVYVDAVTIFTQPQPALSTMTWNVPGGNYRGQGVWVRYTDGDNQFTDYAEADTTGLTLNVSPRALVFNAQRDASPPPPQTLDVVRNCPTFGWQVTSDAAWLRAQPQADVIRVTVEPTGLARGTHQGTLTIAAAGNASVQPVTVPVTLVITAPPSPIFLPLIVR